MSRSVIELERAKQRWLPAAGRGVQVCVPLECPFDQWVHVNDAMRCIELVAREGGNMVVTLACGCPLIAAEHARL